MTAKSLIRQPWHTEYCHSKFGYSDLRANYPTHDMLTPTLPAAVKTGRPLFRKKGWSRKTKRAAYVKREDKFTENDWLMGF